MPLKRVESFWVLLTAKMNKDPIKGPLLVARLNIWSAMIDQAYTKMKTSPILCKCFTSVIIHSCFALNPKYRELPAETDKLLELLQIAFIRGSEDFSLKKQVSKAK